MATSSQAGGDLRLTGVTKQFGSFIAVDGIDLTIAQGEFFAMLGPVFLITSDWLLALCCTGRNSAKASGPCSWPWGKSICSSS